MPTPTPHDIAWFDLARGAPRLARGEPRHRHERWVGMRPKASGLPTVSWEQVVDEVLCVGWIDGVRKPADGGSVIRITPRRDRLGVERAERRAGRGAPRRGPDAARPARRRSRRRRDGPDGDLRRSSSPASSTPHQAALGRRARSTGSRASRSGTAGSPPCGSDREAPRDEGEAPRGGRRRGKRRRRASELLPAPDARPEPGPLHGFRTASQGDTWFDSLDGLL